MSIHRYVAACVLLLLSLHTVAGSMLDGRLPAGIAPRGSTNRFSTLSTHSTSTPLSANWSYANVYDYGAVGDGKTDNTAAFQRAINAVASVGGGTVLLNKGHFLFKGSLNLLQGVTLEGTYAYVPSHPMNGVVNLNSITGTLLMPTAGFNNATGTPFITLQQDSTVKGLVIFYPGQLPDVAPTPFPWTLDLMSNNAAVLDVEMLNCWNCIRAYGAHRHYIARVQGQPINTGVYVDEIYDIGRIENVHFNPWFSGNKAYLAWQLLHGRSFVFGRSDWEYVLNTFSFGYAIGYHFIANTDGNCNGNFVGIGADMAVNASVQVDSSASFGLLITNGEFVAFLDTGFGTLQPGQVPTQVVVTASNGGVVRFVNSAFWGPSVHIARIDGSGTVGFDDCTINAWDTNNAGNGNGEYAIVAGGTGSLLVRGTEFQMAGNQISLGPQLSRAVVTGNLFKGSQKIAGVQANSVRFQVGLNAAEQ